jgi:nucleoside-diphosphate-sugar epimerase
MNNQQIILGAGGIIGSLLAKDLKKYTNQVQLFSRNPKKINDDDVLISGNLLNAEQTAEAIKNNDVAYLMVGLPYKTKVWEKDFLQIVKNVIDGCKLHKVPLVFFDNVYMYDPDCFENLTEETPIKIVSKKGAVRAAIVALLNEEIKRNNINILIARSADFYGENCKNSMFNNQVLNKIVQNKKANWFLDANKKHALTFVKDASFATALLGNTNSAYNQVWHLPTDKAYTATELIEKISVITEKPAKIQVVSKFMISVLSWFFSSIKESKELLYQYDRHYNFNSSKFEIAFNVKPTSIEEGLEQIIASYS